MSKFLPLTKPLYDYMTSISVREREVLRRLREETAASQPDSQMQISPDQGQFMALLVRMMDARKTLEVGVFTGYSSICVALALPADGRMVVCDISEEYTAIAQRYWKAAGVEKKITLHLGPALETMDCLLRDGEGDTFDFVFIDADKANYQGYFERALRLVRPGGLIAIDNVLWSGRVADPLNQEADTLHIRRFNANLSRDNRISLSVLPLADGITLALKG